MLKKDVLETISDHLNPSWRDILLNLPEGDEENDIINILSQPISFDYNIERNGTVFIIWNYCYNSALIINGIISEDKFFCHIRHFKTSI